MTKAYADLCFAAGLDLSNMRQWDVYLAAGKIIRDPELRLKVREAGLDHIEVIAAMTKEERQLLQERVGGVIELKPKKT
ncbi:MAG: hypothetical protein ACRD4X_01945 [Candidatus Acidiferrales bacterium]